MPELILDIPQSILDALEEHGRQTGEPAGHTVSRALADALQLEHGTLFQVSTAGALVEGVSGDAVSIGALREHGDFGLGTFTGFDGEMAALDGRFFRIAADGTVSQAQDGDMTPFAVVTHFVAEQSARLSASETIEDLHRKLNAGRDSDNHFFAARIDGRFTRIEARAVSKQPVGQSLSTAAGSQSVFSFDDVDGTLLGFWTPAYARTVNIAGWHLHFLSDDRTKGGHVLDCSSGPVNCRIEALNDFRIAIPETTEFLRANLAGDPTAALDRAERKREG
jgi:acetolactate decarboxylase